MKLTAIVALSLALLRFVPTRVLEIPVFVFLTVALELAIAHAFFDRPLRTFYFTFLILDSFVLKGAKKRIHRISRSRAGSCGNRGLTA
jgi:hypothetical protein